MSKANREKRTSVRANTAKYTPEKPLFGKYVGSVYRPEHERGVPENGATVESMSNQIQDDALAGKMFSIDEYGYANEVVCPYCGFNYVHFTKARQISGEDKYKASKMYDIGVRGDVIVIPFWCEDGHEWVLVLGEHKGNIFHKTVLLDEEQKGREKNIMSIANEDIKKEKPSIKHLSLIGDVEVAGGRQLITLEMWSFQAKMLADAISTRQTEILCEPQTPDRLYEYQTLEALRTSLVGQMEILCRLNRVHAEAK